MKHRSKETDFTDFSASLSEIRDGIGKLTEGLKNLTREESNEWKATLQEKCEGELKHISHLFEEGAAKLNQTSEMAGERIKENPLKSLALAFGLGYVAGKILETKEKE